MDKNTQTHMHDEISFSHKNIMKSYCFVTTWMDLEGIVLNEIKSEKEKYRRTSLAYESNKQTGRYGEPVSGCQSLRGG